MNSKTTNRQSFVKTGLASRILGVSPATIRAAVRRGDLAGIRLGSHTLVALGPLTRLVERTEHTTPSPTAD